MIDFEKIKKYAICAGIFILLGAICVGTKLLFNFVGDPRRANEIYEQALEDFKKKITQMRTSNSQKYPIFRT